MKDLVQVAKIEPVVKHEVGYQLQPKLETVGIRFQAGGDPLFICVQFPITQLLNAN